jgi:hypothetical protein
MFAGQMTLASFRRQGSNSVKRKQVQQDSPVQQQEKMRRLDDNGDHDDSDVDNWG